MDRIQTVTEMGRSEEKMGVQRHLGERWRSEEAVGGQGESRGSMRKQQEQVKVGVAGENRRSWEKIGEKKGVRRKMLKGRGFYFSKISTKTM